MDIAQWKSEIEKRNKEIAAARDALNKAEEDLANFFKKTIGYAPGDTATLEATVDLIVGVVSMLKS